MMYFVKFSDALRGKHTKLKERGLRLDDKAGDKIEGESEKDPKRAITNETEFWPPKLRPLVIFVTFC
jgi:hypothetical protein